MHSLQRVTERINIADGRARARRAEVLPAPLTLAKRTSRPVARALDSRHTSFVAPRLLSSPRARPAEPSLPTVGRASSPREAQPTREILGHTPQEVVDRIYDLLEHLDRTLRGAEIPYSISSGTLLGAVRHGGLIPWDDDADISIRSKDSRRVAGLGSALAQDGYTLTNTFFGQRLSHNAYPLGPKRRHVPFVDIFLVEPNGRYRSVIARGLWPNDWLPPETFDQPSELSFGHLSLLGPNPDSARQVLDKAYGQDWAVSAQRGANHAGTHDGPTGKQQITDFAPALHSRI